MRALAALAIAFVLSCGDNKVPQPMQQDDADIPDPDSPVVPPGPLAPCLDRPDNLAQPSEQLPCELLPPGLVLP